MFTSRYAVLPAILLATALAPHAAADQAATEERPLMRDFIGINIHSGSIFQDSPEQVDPPSFYRPTAGLIRDYHGFSWDVGDSSSNPVNFPHDTWNWINWDELYSEWTDEGYRINVAVQFGGYGDGEWDDPAADARAYGRAFAEHFGPTVGNGLADSIQIGNEPGHMSDELFATVFRNMAEAVREVDPDLTIVTPNVTDGESHQYAKSIDLFADMTELVDVYATHSYPQIEGWPTWERSYPEDPQIEYLRAIEAVIDWQQANDPDARVWVTEFGYDSTTQEPDPDTEFAEWIGVSDTQQAQYLVRSFLVFSAMDMERAYMFWFNDSDNASVHGSSGLTRHWEPKPSYFAQSHLLETLGDYRFREAIHADEGGLYAYAYEHEQDPAESIWVVWSATGEDREMEVTLEDLPGEVVRAERMPLSDEPAPEVDFEQVDTGSIQLTVSESPTYLWITATEPAAQALPDSETVLAQD